MFRLIGFQCVITKPSAESAFRLTSGLPPPDREDAMWELADAESQGHEPHLPKKDPRIPNKDEGRDEATAICGWAEGAPARCRRPYISCCRLLLPISSKDTRQLRDSLYRRLWPVNLWVVTQTVPDSKYPEQMFWNYVQVRIEFGQLWWKCGAKIKLNPILFPVHRLGFLIDMKTAEHTSHTHRQVLQFLLELLWRTIHVVT